MTATTSEYLSCAETAKLVRAALKRAFTDTKFSVRSRTYAGGASIDIEWIDGPRSKLVEPIAHAYEGADFDGSIDLKTYRDHWLRPDGSVFVAHDPGSQGSGGCNPPEDNRGLAKVMPEGVRLVHFGANFIFCSRNISDYDAKYTEAVAYYYAHFKSDGEQTGNPDVDRFGNRWVSEIARNWIYDRSAGETIESAVRRFIDG